MKRAAFLCVSILLFVPLLSLAQDEDGAAGEDDLQALMQLALKEDKTLEDTERLIALCETSLGKELSAEDRRFCRELLVTSLWTRASSYAAPILSQRQPDARWQQLRDLASRDLEKLLLHDDQFRDAYFLLGQLQLLPGGDLFKAKLAIDRAVDLYQDDPRKAAESLLLRAALRLDSGDRLADLDAAVLADPTFADALSARANHFRQRGNFAKATDDLRKLLENDPENARILVALAQTFANLKQFDEALGFIDRAIKLQPDDASNYRARAEILEDAERPREAIAELDKAIERDPGNTSTVLARAWMLYRIEELDRARADVDRLVRQDPGNNDALLLRSIIAETQKRYRDAISDLEQILEELPNRIELKIHLARLLVLDERPRKAVRALTGILEEIGDVEANPALADVYQLRANALLSIGKHAEAIQDYAKGLALQPDDDGILNNLAWVLATSPFAEVRDAKRSIELATKACEVTEYKLPHILSTLAAAYAESGDFETAIKWSTKAVEIGKAESQDQLEQLEQELESYKQKKPWRELQEVEEKPDPPRNLIET